MTARVSKGILLGAGIFMILLVSVLHPLWTLPDRLPALSLLMSRTVVDRAGVPLHLPLNSRGERATILRLAEIPPSIQEAFITAEDKRFYRHDGVDWLALGRALWQSVRHLEILSGASTITMQLVRIHWPELSGALGKPAQILQAMRVERNHGKGEILSHYLNLVPFARQVVGVAQGCTHYFGKDCDRLSLAETATLAVIPRNPGFYTRNREALKRSRDFLIRKLGGQERLASLAEEQARREPVRLKFKPVGLHAAHLGIRVLKDTRDRPDSIIRTTLDRALQTSLQKLLRQEVSRNSGLGDTGGILVVHNPTAEIRAYVGSPDFFEPSHGMFDTIQAPRSPGSALKPFVYALALERGWTLSSLLPDMPVQFKARKGVYAPGNYGGGFSGPRQVRFALANSQNLPALYLAFLLGESSVLNHLRTIGFDHLDRPGDHYGVGLVLGNGEVTLWELAQAYSMIARSGYMKPLRFLADEAGDSGFLGERVLSAESAYLIAETLSDPLARSEEFGRGGPLEFDYPVAVKTGTSSDYRDHWTMGFTREYTVGVWRGNADGRPMKRKLPAARGTGKIFHRVMDRLQGREKLAWFKKPESVIHRQVCSLSGKLPGPYCNATREELFVGGKEPKERCSMHRSITIADCLGESREIRYVDLAEKYLPWARAERIPTLDRQLAEVCGISEPWSFPARHTKKPRILEPIHDTVLAFDPTMPAEFQEMRILLENTRQKDPVHLYVDDRFVGDVTGKTEVFWRLKKGVHRIHLKRGSTRIEDGVRITVL